MSRSGCRSCSPRGRQGRITLQQFVALTATNHARIYGLAGRKGSIAPGLDADIVLWDPTRQVTIRQEIMHHGADYTPWEGFEVTGWPRTTILRGEVVMWDGEIIGAKGGGSFSAAIARPTPSVVRVSSREFASGRGDRARRHHRQRTRPDRDRRFAGAYRGRSGRGGAGRG